MGIYRICVGQRRPQQYQHGYPILRFSEVPEIEAELVDGAGNPTLGVGECSCGPTAAAVGNAVAHALGVRIHDMPLTRERILKALA